MEGYKAVTTTSVLSVKIDTLRNPFFEATRTCNRTPQSASSWLHSYIVDKSVSTVFAAAFSCGHYGSFACIKMGHAFSQPLKQLTLVITTYLPFLWSNSPGISQRNSSFNLVTFTFPMTSSNAPRCFNVS